jgi:hypothetical protein
MARFPEIHVVDRTLFLKNRLVSTAVPLDLVEHFLVVMIGIITDAGTVVKMKLLSVDAMGDKELVCDWAHPSGALLPERQNSWITLLMKVTGKSVQLENRVEVMGLEIARSGRAWNS